VRCEWWMMKLPPSKAPCTIMTAGGTIHPPIISNNNQEQWPLCYTLTYLYMD
jgi:hypothetical protein